MTVAPSDRNQAIGALMTVVGGLIVSQCLTLFITPVVYLYLESFQQRFSRKAVLTADGR